MDFEFDSNKSEINLLKHGISFTDAQQLWANETVEILAKNLDEQRWLVIGTIKGIFWSAIITRRERTIRIISVRRSRHEEKEIYSRTY
jgi:uncharacterized protein